MKSCNHNYQIFNQNCNSKFLLLCDHASNHIPKCISETQLGLDDVDLNRHIAYDLGAKEIAIELSEFLEAPLILSNFSRLVIDPNRSLEDPTSIMQIYDGTIIPGNLHLSKAKVYSRQTHFYNSYHNAISKFITAKKKQDITPCIVSIHSFSPQLKFEGPRPWHIGVLWNRDTRLSDLFIKELEKYNDICIGKNEPYSGDLEGDTLSKHGTTNNLPNILIEFRNDLIADKTGQKKWGEIVGKVLTKSVYRLQE